MAISTFLATGWAYVLAAVLAFNLYQRRHLPLGSRKRLATLYIAAAVGSFHVAGLAVVHSTRLFGLQLDDRALVPVSGLVGYLAWRHREKIWPFRSRCPRCENRYSWRELLFVDDPNCPACGSPGAAED